jgi:hypothetical protein
MILLFASLWMGALAQATNPERALPMGEVHACAIQFRDAAASQGKWGGQVALYDATTDARGVVIRLTRRIIREREHLPPLVRLDQFEACVKEWRFGGQAVYEVSLLGGTTSEGQWVIQVRKGNQQFRIRMPIWKLTG